MIPVRDKIPKLKTSNLHHFWYIPNVITCLRMLMLLPFIGVFLNGHYVAAFVIFVVAGLSDALDGFLARTFHWQTPLGSFLDPLADKLLLMISFILLGYHGIIDAWVVLLVLLRDAAIMWGAATYYWIFGNVEFQPTIISKINTVLQVFLVFLLLYELAYRQIPDYILSTLIITVATSAVLSMVDYVWTWSKYAYTNWNHQ